MTHANIAPIVEEDATEAAQQRRLSPKTRELLGNSWIVLVLIALLVVFTIANPHFFTAFNVTSILVNASMLAILAVGETYVIITAGIDLSVGSVLVFASVVSVILMRDLGGASAGWGVTVLGIVVGVAGGLLWGLINGVLIAKTKVPPLIVTLGTLGMALGIAEIMTGGVDVAAVPSVFVNTVGFGKAAGFPSW